MKLGKAKRKRDDGRYTMELDDSSCPAEYDSVPVRVGWKTYYIPVDSHGYVPTWAIVSRFHEVCDSECRRNDLGSDDDRILPPRLTPKEIAEWWADPSTMDISGVDTADAEFYDVSCIDDPIMADIQSRIAVISQSREEAERIRLAIAEAFDYAELDEMTEGRSFIIQTVPDGGDAYGVFMKRQKGIPTPILIYEAGASVATIIHEMTHFARTMPSRRAAGRASTAFPLTDDGEMDMDAISRMPREDVERMTAVEESDTVKEALLRTPNNVQPSGYYDDVHNGKSPTANQRIDQRILKGPANKMVRNGKQVVKRINLEKDRTMIAMAEIVSRESAKSAAKKLYSGKKGKNEGST